MECWICMTVWAAAMIVFLKLFFGRRGSKEIIKKDWQKDTVYLYQFPRLPTIPNISPFCLKVETFLKANNINYEVCPVLARRSQYGYVPFVELNGEHIADSQVIIHQLSKHFDVKRHPVLPQDEAIARAVDRMVDTHTFFVLRHFVVVENAVEFCSLILRNMNFPASLISIAASVLSFCMKRKVINRIAAGVGLMSTDDYKEILKKDYDALKTLLGEQKFLFGDSISTVDCTVFGHLATIFYIPTASYAKDLLKEEYPSLVAYLERVKETVYGKDFASE
ncbi:unnamed protein product [Cylicocyclus nassatus]|uniref:GST C-terminal domain-containing protein n=1 Tax=Cylicocyclus nassatus TaxID=53992 RepID=A0AA36GTL0_CYLNA|nr:unnamed protein product [Cylicocyclus nassatus]